jgi:hypothetical protein
VFSVRSVSGCYNQDSHLRMSPAREAVKIRPERLKLKNLCIVRGRCQGTTGEDTAGWKTLSGCCGDL